MSGFCLYPGAGMIVMAVEAARQMANIESVIRGYCFRDVTFHKALKTSLRPEGTEVQFYLRPLVSIDERDNEWSDFRICMLEEGMWAENCRGQISIEYEKEKKSVVDGGKEAREEASQMRTGLQDCLERCKMTTDSSQFYTNLNNWGFGLGKPFQMLQDISYSNEGRAAAAVDLYDEATQTSRADSQSSVLHPVTLDGILQLVFPSLIKGGLRKIPTMVPTRVRKLWISSSGLNSREANQVTGYSEAIFTGNRGAEASIVALDKVTGEVRVKVEGLETTTVVGPSGDLEKRNERRLCYSIDWKPDLDLLDKNQVLAYCNTGRPSPLQPVEFCQDLEFLCFSYMSTLLDEFNHGDLPKLQPHLQKYINWIERRIADFHAGMLQISRPVWKELLQDQKYQDDLHKRIKGSNIQGDFYIEVARNLRGIFHGQVDVLDLLFRGDLVSSFYRNAEGPWNCMKQLMRYLDSMSHKNPGMHILEIGAGTGGATAPVLEVLKGHGDNENGVSRYRRYDYTDISPSFFEKARILFKDHSDRIHFSTLDIEDDPSNQGYSSEAYDVVFAANVVHATKDLSLTLRNTRRLLKPGGKLILLEVCNPELLGTGFAFGLLNGWWLSTEQKRQWSPLLFEKNWNELLSQTGFSGVDVTFRDYEDDRCHETSIMISTAVEPLSKRLSIPPIAIITSENPSMHQTSLVQQLCMYLTEKGCPGCELKSIKEVALLPALEKMFCISVLEIDLSFFADIDPENFEALKTVTKKSKGLMWLTHGCGRSPIKPEMDIVTGFLRSSRTEYAKSMLIQLAIESPILSTAQEIDIIYKVLERTVNSPLDSCEVEYAESGGVLYISRIVEAKQLNKKIHSRTLQHRAAIQEIRKCPPLQLRIESPGLLDTLEFVNDQAMSLALAADEIEVEVRACGVNFRDVLIALGRYNDNALGSECAGIVRKVGAAVDLQPGDRVCVCVLGTYKTFIRCKAFHAAKIPDSISYVEAAALPTTSTTVYYALHDIARLKTGESLLIHSATGGTGQAAIQVAKLVNAEIYATVGSEEKKKFLTERYNIPADRIFDSRDLSFARGIMRMTRSRGVDVVLNSLAGEGLIASWECIAPFGRFIEIGKKDIESHGKLPMYRFAKNVSFAAIDLAHITRENPKLLCRLLGDVMELVKFGKVRPAQPIHIYQASKVEEAFRFLQSGKNSGKTILELNLEDSVPTVLETKPAFLFDKNATYVIAGGLGGLGRSIARWMATRGAMYLILLSRSGLRSESAILFVKELEGRGVCVEAAACDVTSADSLASTLSRCKHDMPPIKGCIQGTMVLKDSILEKMSAADFKKALEPKVRGSWNLHSQLPKGMEFFILLSSLTGVIGMGGQANYASGNTYQDALARHRIAMGEKAVAIDLGMMLDVGFVAESKAVQDSMNAKGFFMGVSESEFHALLEHYCDPTLALLTAFQSQVVTGMEVPATLRVKGVEEPYWMRKPMFQILYQIDLKSEGNSSDQMADLGPVNYETLFAAAGSVAEVGILVCDAIVKELSRTLGTPTEDIDTARQMHYYGVDSLVALELRNWFIKDMNADVAIFDILGGTTISALSLLVASRTCFLKTSVVESSKGEGGGNGA